MPVAGSSSVTVAVSSSDRRSSLQSTVIETLALEPPLTV